jgi:hypothetical protein
MMQETPFKKQNKKKTYGNHTSCVTKNHLQKGVVEWSVMHKMLQNFAPLERLVLNILDNVYESEPTTFKKCFFLHKKLRPNQYQCDNKESTTIQLHTKFMVRAKLLQIESQILLRHYKSDGVLKLNHCQMVIKEEIRIPGYSAVTGVHEKLQLKNRRMAYVFTF